MTGTGTGGLVVHRAGSRDPGAPHLLLVHGLGGSSALWNGLVAALGADHRLDLVDLPGHGASPAPTDPAGMRPAALGRRLLALAAATAAHDGAPVHLVGHSYGGWVCLEAAAGAGGPGGPVAGVVALAPAGLWTAPRRRPPLLPTGQRLARAALAVEARLGRDLVTTRPGRVLALAATSAAPHRVPPGAARAAVDAVAAAAGYAAADAAIAAGSFTRGADVRVPVTVVAGRRDRVLPRSHLLRSAAPPGARWLEWDRCGHVPLWDRLEDCARVVREDVRAARATG